MPVLIQGFSVVVRIKTIEEQYPGGINAYRHICSGQQDFSADDNIASWLGFPTLAHAKELFRILVDAGFRYVADADFDEIAIVEQAGGIIIPCKWLEFGGMKIAEFEERIPVCKLVGCTSMNVNLPRRWLDAYKNGRRCVSIDDGAAERRIEETGQKMFDA